MPTPEQSFTWKLIASLTATLAASMVVGWFAVARNSQSQILETKEGIAEIRAKQDNVLQRLTAIEKSSLLNAAIRSEQVNILRRLLAIETKLEKAIDDRYRSAEASRDFAAVYRSLNEIREMLKEFRHSHRNEVGNN